MWTCSGLRSASCARGSSGLRGRQTRATCSHAIIISCHFLASSPLLCCTSIQLAGGCCFSRSLSAPSKKLRHHFDDSITRDHFSSLLFSSLSSKAYRSYLQSARNSPGVHLLAASSRSARPKPLSGANAAGQ